MQPKIFTMFNNWDLRNGFAFLIIIGNLSTMRRICI